MIFVTPDAEVTASAGDLMTVPPGAIHTFKNASETEDAECYMTATPGAITPKHSLLRLSEVLLILALYGTLKGTMLTVRVDISALTPFSANPNSRVAERWRERRY